MIKKVDTGLPDCFDRPVFNFAIDFELFWGNAFKHGQEMTVEERMRNAQYALESLDALKKVMQDLQMPCTWAVVGKLMEPTLSPATEKRFSPPWSKTDWYAIPPNVDMSMAQANQFIRNLKLNSQFEIVSHGFAHIEFADESVTRDIAFEDIRLAKEVLSEVVNTPEAFIYSSNKVCHSDVLDDLGYHIIRGDKDKWELDERAEVVRTPEGFWMSPAMIGLSQAKQLVNEGVKNRSFIHPWIHPRDVNFKADDVHKFFMPYFKHIKNLEKEGTLEILSFKEIWKRLNP